MSDKAEMTSPADDKLVNETKADSSSATSFGEVKTSTPVRLFGQFKQNGFGSNQVSTTSTFSRPLSKEPADNDQNAASTYFTSTLSKISSTMTGGFSSSSTPLAASLASLGANKTLFGGSSATVTSSFTDLKATSTNPLENGATGDKTDGDENKKDEDDEDEDDNRATLLETVAEYEAKRASTHPATTIQGDTSTGEENEVTKFQMPGKLFMYSAEQQQFVERGYGVLKINESFDPSSWDKLQARIIMRLDKSFRVILNSPIFPQMTVDRAGDRSVRFGAQDESHLRVFLIKSSTIDCASLYKELKSRIKIIEDQQSSGASKTNTPTKSNTSGSSDVLVLDDSSSEPSAPVVNRKRSHSKSDSDTSDSANELSKKSKLVEGRREVNKRVNRSTNEDDSIGSNKADEQDTARN